MSQQNGYGIRDKFAVNQALHDVIALLFNMYEQLCPALLEHSRDLAVLCEKLAKELGWDETGCKYAFLAGLFHDIGHLTSPGNICNWKGEEPPPHPDMATKHPEYGEKLLKKVHCLIPIMPAIRHHHEHFNGSGFPDGLKGDNIPEIARLVSVAHQYQTLTKGYLSTPPMSREKAMSIMAEDEGIVVDPLITEVFLARVC